MVEPVLAIVLFTATVLGLVLLILLARRVLLPDGVAHLRVNDRLELDVPLGARLLATLGEAGLALPAACGGKGTCGQCRVEIVGGEVPPALPTDAERLAPRDLARGARLACQLVVRGDLTIRVPDEIFGVRSFACRVRSARCVGTMIREIVLDLPEGEPLAFRAGSYVQVTAPPYRARFREFAIDEPVRAEWDRLDLWRHEAASGVETTRAYSLANPPADDRSVVLLVRLALPPAGAPENTPPGVVSSWLFSLKPGDPVEVGGPYGHFFALDSERDMVFVGGGAGMAPLRSHILDQLERLHTKRAIHFWYGARNRRELFYAEEFDRLARTHANFQWSPALSEPLPEDEWQGAVGFVHDVLEREHLREHPAPERCEFYLCGPPLMARATLDLLARYGVPPDQILFDDFGA